MTIYEAIVSGIIQGITEFFPISSSGHLVIFHSIFGAKQPQLAFDIFLHFGTIVSVLIFFRKDIVNIFLKDRRMLFLVILGSIPAFAIGMIFKDRVEQFFGMPKAVGYMLLLTGIWLVLASLGSIYLQKRGVKKGLGALNSLGIGLAQGIAILPGISRSGATIATGLLFGLDGETAVKFSFLLSVPAVLGANVLKAAKIGSGLVGRESLFFLIGAMVAAIIGFFAIKALLKLVKDNLFIIFGIYCLLVGSLVIMSF